MAEPRPSAAVPTECSVSSIGLVVHPVRDVSGPLNAVEEWAREHGADIVQIPFSGEQPDLYEEREARDCDLVVAIGGDGTALAAIRAAASADRPILGVACGSLGALTSVAARDVRTALDRYDAGEWRARALPALGVRPDTGDDFLAFNDLVIVRNGEGQVRVAVRADGALYARMAGDGCIVSTPVGSSAYTIAAGGPLIDPGVLATVVTALPTHGGFIPPLLVGADAELELEIATGHGGARLEVDGRVRDGLPERLKIRLRPDEATVVTFPDQPSHLAGLRERGIITDSPRILADDALNRADGSTSRSHLESPG